MLGTPKAVVALQPSVAVAPPWLFNQVLMSAALPVPSQLTVRLEASVPMVGGTKSCTVNVAVVELLLPHSSVTVKVTVAAPVAPHKSLKAV